MSEEIQKIFNQKDCSPEFISEQKKNGKNLGHSVIDHSECFLVIGCSQNSNDFEIKIIIDPAIIPSMLVAMERAKDGLLRLYNKVKNIQNNN